MKLPMHENHLSSPSDGATNCVLLFSGGRDSSLSAVRLARQFTRVTLVTVTADHLTGLQAVHRRLDELERVASGQFEWISVRAPRVEARSLRGASATCLPCQLAYVLVGAQVAATLRTPNIAFGYSGYQAAWPEQTPYSVKRLTDTLLDFGLALALPVYTVSSKSNAADELLRSGLSPDSLEQKCVRQVTNKELEPNELRPAIDAWVTLIASNIPAARAWPFDVTSRRTIASPHRAQDVR